MKNYNSWKKSEDLNEVSISKEEFTEMCKKYFDYNLSKSLISYPMYVDKPLVEAVELSRYSIEVNYRTKKEEALEGFAKICLGYVSAALKRHGYHTKHVFTEKPLRLLVSSRNWDDGEWVGLVSWNPSHECFVVSKGFYNKSKRTVNIQKSDKCTSDNAADISKDLHNMMNSLKGKPNNHVEKLKPVPLKRGPKR